MRYYAVIDTNVLVSALLSAHDDSATVQILSKLFSGDIIPVFSEKILAEYNEVLRRKKFHFIEEVVSRLIDVIEKYGFHYEPEASGEKLPDMKDIPFYEVVVQVRNNHNAYLVTGNIKHFPICPFIVTARTMLDIMQNRSRA